MFGNGIRTCRKITEKNKKKGYGKKKETKEGRREREIRTGRGGEMKKTE